MTVRGGEFVVAGDCDLGDVYIAQCIKPGASPAANPFLRVLTILRYPMQRAILYADIAHENPPIMPEDICQLSVHRLASPEEVARARSEGYEASLARALQTEIEDVRRRIARAAADPQDASLYVNPRELALLEAHRKGIYVRKRRSSVLDKRKIR